MVVCSSIDLTACERLFLRLFSKQRSFDVMLWTSAVLTPQMNREVCCVSTRTKVGKYRWISKCPATIWEKTDKVLMFQFLQLPAQSVLKCEGVVWLTLIPVCCFCCKTEFVLVFHVIFLKASLKPEVMIYLSLKSCCTSLSNGPVGFWLVSLSRTLGPLRACMYYTCERSPSSVTS